MQTLETQVLLLRQQVIAHQEWLDTVTSRWWKRVWWWAQGYRWDRVGRWY